MVAGPTVMERVELAAPFGGGVTCSGVRLVLMWGLGGIVVLTVRSIGPLKPPTEDTTMVDVLELPREILRDEGSALR